VILKWSVFPILRKAHDLTRTRKAKSDLRRLTTEQILPAATDLDRMSSLEIVRLINREDSTVAAAVAGALPQIARAIDVIVAGLRQGGRLIYVGAGTSGRIGALDASEIRPRSTPTLAPCNTSWPEAPKPSPPPPRPAKTTPNLPSNK
jgi:hypothetical protein